MRHHDRSFGVVNRHVCALGGWGGYYKVVLDAGLPSPGAPAFSLRFWYVEAGYSLSPSSCWLGAEVMAYGAL